MRRASIMVARTFSGSLGAGILVVPSVRGKRHDITPTSDRLLGYAGKPKTNTPMKAWCASSGLRQHDPRDSGTTAQLTLLSHLSCAAPTPSSQQQRSQSMPEPRKCATCGAPIREFGKWWVHVSRFDPTPAHSVRPAQSEEG